MENNYNILPYINMNKYTVSLKMCFCWVVQMWHLKQEMNESEDPILWKIVQELIKGMAYVISLNNFFFSHKTKENFKIGACGLTLWWISQDILKSVCINHIQKKKLIGSLVWLTISFFWNITLITRKQREVKIYSCERDEQFYYWKNRKNNSMIRFQALK